LLLDQPGIDPWLKLLFKQIEEFKKDYAPPTLISELEKDLPRTLSERDWETFQDIPKPIRDKLRFRSYVILKAYSPIERYEFEHSKHPFLRLANATLEKMIAQSLVNLPIQLKKSQHISQYLKTFKARLIKLHCSEVSDFMNQSTPEWDEELLKLLEEGIYLLPEPPHFKF